MATIHINADLERKNMIYHSGPNVPFTREDFLHVLKRSPSCLSWSLWKERYVSLQGNYVCMRHGPTDRASLIISLSYARVYYLSTRHHTKTGDKDRDRAPHYRLDYWCALHHGQLFLAKDRSEIQSIEVDAGTSTYSWAQTIANNIPREKKNRRRAPRRKRELYGAVMSLYSEDILPNRAMLNSSEIFMYGDAIQTLMDENGDTFQGSILYDLGCGYGLLALATFLSCDLLEEVVGVEFSPQKYEICSKAWGKIHQDLKTIGLLPKYTSSGSAESMAQESKTQSLPSVVREQRESRDNDQDGEFNTTQNEKKDTPADGDQKNKENDDEDHTHIKITVQTEANPSPDADLRSFPTPGSGGSEADREDFEERKRKQQRQKEQEDAERQRHDDARTFDKGDTERVDSGIDARRDRGGGEDETDSRTQSENGNNNNDVYDDDDDESDTTTNNNNNNNNNKKKKPNPDQNLDVKDDSDAKVNKTLLRQKTPPPLSIPSRPSNDIDEHRGSIHTAENSNVNQPRSGNQAFRSPKSAQSSFTPTASQSKSRTPRLPHKHSNSIRKRMRRRRQSVSKSSKGGKRGLPKKGSSPALSAFQSRSVSRTENMVQVTLHGTIRKPSSGEDAKPKEVLRERVLQATKCDYLHERLEGIRVADFVILRPNNMLRGPNVYFTLFSQLQQGCKIVSFFKLPSYVTGVRPMNLKSIPKGLHIYRVHHLTV